MPWSILSGLSKWVYVIAGMALVAGVLFVYWYGFKVGEASQKVDQLEAQIEQNQRTKKAFDEINRETPIDNDRAVQLKWLRGFVR